jgi:hypothetical protein
MGLLGLELRGDLVLRSLPSPRESLTNLGNYHRLGDGVFSITSKQEHGSEPPFVGSKDYAACAGKDPQLWKSARQRSTILATH